ncbi:MAG TPA: hypothetical protein VL176_04520, partial [Steroidobacteraceae bacterium]|nr:hypothetical protein [Steroidobacteraceae bacterium]
MRGLNRRDLLMGLGSLYAGLISRRAAAALSAKIPPAPVARVAVVKDSYFGETLSDPYRWMENDKDPEWLPFLRGQNAHARAVLDAIPGRSQLLKRIAELSGDAASTRSAQRAGGQLFFEQRPVGADNFRLYVRHDGVDRVLIDPTQLSDANGHMSLDWWEPSPDGAHVVYGLSRDGSEDSVLHVLRVADGRDLPERIANTEAAHPQWLDDGSGFFYNQLMGAVDTPERYLDSQARFHRLGSDPAGDPILMKRGLDANVPYERIQVPVIRTFYGSKHALLMLADVRTEFRVLIAPLADAVANRARWVPVAGFEDEITDVEIDGGTLWLLANRGHPRGRILRTAVGSPAVAGATEVVPEGKVVIESLQRAKDGLYLNMMDGGVSGLRRLERTGHVTEIPLPFDGTLQALSCQATEEGALFAFTGWLTAGEIWAVDGEGKVTPTGLTPKPPIEVGPYETTHSFATARDGTKIPYTLLH